jgi:hypothetical protein
MICSGDDRVGVNLKLLTQAKIGLEWATFLKTELIGFGRLVPVSAA